MNNKSIDVAITMLQKIENDTELNAVLKSDTRILTEDAIGIELFSIEDKEATINDFIMMCDYDEQEALIAYNNLKDY
mgnify:FL=1